MINLYRWSCNAYPYHSNTTRRTTQNLRRKYIKALKMLGIKYILHPANATKRK